jgi:hypothetical protein
MTEQSKAARKQDRRCAYMLFLLLNALFILTSTGRVHTQDENMTTLTVVNLVERGTTELAPWQLPNGMFYGRYDVQGNPRPAYGFGHASFLAPWYLAGKMLAALPSLSAAAKDTTVVFVVVLSSATFAAGAAIFGFLLFRKLGIPIEAAIVATLALALGTQLFAYSAWMFAEPLIAVLSMAAAWICFGERGASAISPRRAVWAGLLLGTAVLVRPTAIILVAVFGAAILISLRKNGIRPAMLLMSMAGLVTTLLLAYNSAIFGSAFQFGYPEVVENQKAVGQFETPLWLGLRGFLLSPGKSIFIFSPPIIAAVVALPALWKRDRGLAALAAGAPIASLLFFSLSTYWDGGFSYGPRYLLPGLTLLCLSLGCYFADADRRKKALGYALALLGVAVQVIGIMINYVEAERTGGYYDAQWKYRIEYNALLAHLRTVTEYWSGNRALGAGPVWDRWFIFVTGNGFPWGVAVAILCLVGLIAVLAALGMGLAYREARMIEAELVSNAAASVPAG